jgi:hypothetical protein
MRLVWHSQPCCGVDALPDAPEPVRYAVGELRRFIARKTACELPPGPVNGTAVVLRLAADGSQYRAALGETLRPESYAVGSDATGVHLVGADPLGLVFAVFDFLREEVGIGFGGLGDLGVRIAFCPDLEVHVRPRRCAPDLKVRALQGAIREDAVEAAGGISPLHLPRLDWMVQNRMNTYLLDPGQAPDFSNIRRLLPEVKRRGLKVQWGHHAWNRWVPVERYGKTHPEYYALQKGRRLHPARGGQATTGADSAGEQLSLCTSNPAVAEVMAREILAVLAEHPEVDIISLWQEDGTGMCECSECARISDLPSGWVYDYYPGTDQPVPRSYRDRNKTVRYARFVNEVARRVGAVRPETLLSAAFYHDMDAPPEGVTLESNIQPVLAHYWRCWRHPLDHPQCENTYYNRITEEWAAQYPGRLVIYDYLMGMSCYSSLPWNIVPRMVADWRRYHRLGIAGATVQSQACHFTVYGPVYSAFARLAWQLDQPLADIAQPYFCDMYEEAAAPILRLMELLDRRFAGEAEPRPKEPGQARQFPDCLYPQPSTITRILNDATVAAMDECLRQAHAEARQDRTRSNVAKLQAAADYWQQACAFFRAVAVAQGLAARQSDQTLGAIQACLDLCDGIIARLDLLPYPDVVSREMIVHKHYWPLHRRALATCLERPFDPDTRWPT